MNETICYLLIPVSALITAVSQILLKKSAAKRHRDFIHEYLNACVIISYAFYFLVVFLNIFIFTKVDYRFSVVINSLAISRSIFCRLSRYSRYCSRIRAMGIS